MSELSLESKIDALRIAGLYNILFRIAGVGCLFYEGPVGNDGELPPNWQTKLVVHHYYRTFTQAIEDEYRVRLEGAARNYR